MNQWLIPPQPHSIMATKWHVKEKHNITNHPYTNFVYVHLTFNLVFKATQWYLHPLKYVYSMFSINLPYVSIASVNISIYTYSDTFGHRVLHKFTTSNFVKHRLLISVNKYSCDKNLVYYFYTYTLHKSQPNVRISYSKNTVSSISQFVNKYYIFHYYNISTADRA